MNYRYVEYIVYILLFGIASCMLNFLQSFVHPMFNRMCNVVITLSPFMCWPKQTGCGRFSHVYFPTVLTFSTRNHVLLY